MLRYIYIAFGDVSSILYTIYSWVPKKSKFKQNSNRVCRFFCDKVVDITNILWFVRVLECVTAEKEKRMERKARGELLYWRD